ncbi:hypothetical protein FG386_001146 [Cryptosporidium ryanae]|uniref:uncharacterized protein n=1 Tax=Cryptosporidium ryanae TaxID=515981 RepID=UPI00351A0BE0|nr:hypothetical protein FG386_001146 [Cryptosporidium ryanae]
MACSKYEYIKDYESPVRILKNCWFIVRIDGHSFHEFTREHGYDKPNDKDGLDLMNRCAENIMKSISDIVISYGQSDEYSFVFRRRTDLWGRRADKILTHVVSLFTSTFVMFWSNYFPGKKLKYPPTFDGRVVVYPTDEDIRAYLSWRQVDCHINNLYNTCFWSLVSKKNMSEKEATEKLKFTVSSDKNEMLFSEFGINYNSIPAQFRKGTLLYRPKPKDKKSRKEYMLMKSDEKRKPFKVNELNEGNVSDSLFLNPVWKENGNVTIIKSIFKCHDDIIQDMFWNDNQYLLK